MFHSNDWDRAVVGKTIQVIPLSDSVPAEVVHFKDREKDSYGDYFQGEDEIYLIFKVGDQFYKKIGHKSSYGYENTSWDGPCVEVQPITKTIQVFE